MATPFFINSFFLNYILPFVLVFTLIFAILQKTKLLGKDKKQIDAIVALIIGLILIAFPFARDIVVKIMPFLAVSIVILLIFMLGYGFVYQGKKVEMKKWLKITIMVIFALALVTAILLITGAWDKIYDFVFGREEGAQIWINILLVAVMAGAIIAVLKGKGKGDDDEDDDDDDND